jgi:hypothetical protein
MDTEESSDNTEHSGYDIEATKSKSKAFNYKNIALEIGSDEEEIKELASPESTTRRRLKQIFKLVLPLALLFGFNFFYHLTLEKCPLDLHQNPVF